MTEETKKLITAGMLSDVLGRRVISIVTFVNTSARGMRVLVYKDENLLQRGISAYELKDKLEEWLCRNKPKGYRYELGLYESIYHKKVVWSAIIQIGYPFHRSMQSGECETKLEVLLKLYNAVKGE